jgi:succinate dehydrogenase / fumarate reductase cytochrome b subunit
VAEVAADAGALSDRYHFLVRRLHSLSGIIPVGVFLCIHLSVNASIIAGPKAFQYAVDQIHKLDGLGILKPVELCFILIPIAFHAFVGVLIWLESRPNLASYQHVGNLRYTLQRWTGLVAIAFILIHLWHVHWAVPLPGGGLFDAHAAADSTIAALGAWWAGPVYAIGVLCAVFHFANGIWTFLIVWGITIGPRSQTMSGGVCAVIGILLGLLGFGALIKLKTMDVSTPAPPAATTHTTAYHHGPDFPV